MHDAPPPPLDRQGIGRLHIRRSDLPYRQHTQRRPSRWGYAVLARSFDGVARPPPGGLTSVAVTHPQQPPAAPNPYAAPAVPESIPVNHVRETLPFVVRLSPLKFAWA